MAYPVGAPVPPPGYGPTGLIFAQTVPTPATRASDERALSRIEWVAILTIVVGVVGAVFELTGRVSGLVSVTRTAAGTTISLPSPWIWVGYVGAEAVVGLLVILLFRQAFRGLAPFDPRFPTPATLALVAFIGVILVVGGAGILIAAVYEAASCAGAGHPITSSCLPFGGLGGGLALIGIGVLIALVGFIGILIGVWRLGTRHNEALFKVAAILLIFPFLDIVGSILLLIAARSTRRKLGALGGPAVPLGAK